MPVFIDINVHFFNNPYTKKLYLAAQLT